MSTRKPDPDSIHHVTVHTSHGRRYAATACVEYKDGKRTRKYIHWGTVSPSPDNTFEPNSRYLNAPQDEREKLVFPADWDISAVTALREKAGRNADGAEAAQAPAGAPGSMEDGNAPGAAAGSARKEMESRADRTPEEGDAGKTKDTSAAADSTTSGAPAAGTSSAPGRVLLYGSVWFLLALARENGLTADLMALLPEDETVWAALTLVVFPYLYGKRWDRLVRWQEISWFPVHHHLTPSAIARCLARIPADCDRKLLKRRIRGAGPYVLCLSCTQAQHAGMPSSEGAPVPGSGAPAPAATREAVIWSPLQEPVYCRSFPGTVSETDAALAAAEVFREETDGQVPLICTPDIGRPVSGDCFDPYFRNGLAFVSCADTRSEPVTSCLQMITYDSDGIPVNMDYDRDLGLYCAEFTLSGRRYTGSDDRAHEVPPEDYRCSVFVDPAVRIRELPAVRAAVQEEYASLEESAAAGVLAGEGPAVNARLRYHTVSFVKDPEHPDTWHTDIYEDRDRIRRENAACGCFAFLTYRAEAGTAAGKSPSLPKLYQRMTLLTDMQRAYFADMRDLVTLRQPDASLEAWEEMREDAANFILHLGLLLDAMVRNKRARDEALQKSFRTPEDILDEMTKIRLYELPDGTGQVSLLSAAQTEICRAYGITVPDSTAPFPDV